MDIKNSNVGFIGLGVMGKHIADRLLNAGAKLNVYTRTKKTAEDIIAKGAVWYNTPAELAPHCEIIFTMVGYPKDVEEVYLSEHGLLKAVKPQTVLVDMTTSSPVLAENIFNIAKNINVDVLDAPVSGGDIGAKNGTLSIMVGGDKAVFEKVCPFFQCIGSTFALQGNAGCGQHTKMANQIAVAGNLFATVEAICYAEKAGLNPNTTLKAITGGAAGSWQLTNNGNKMLEKDFSPGFYVKHFLKDLNIALSVAKELNLKLPVLELAQSFFDKMNKIGYSEKGTQAIYEYYKQL